MTHVQNLLEDILRLFIKFLEGLKAPPRPAHIRRVVLHIDGDSKMSTATLTWTIPTTRVDGTALAAAEIDHVEIFDGGVSLGSVQGAMTTFTTGVLTVGAHTFTVTTTDVGGHTSAPSNAVTVTVPVTQAAPSAITDLQATLNA
jgi:hypothetical protein